MLNTFALLRDTWRSLIMTTTPELCGLFDYYINDSGVTGVCKAFDAAAFDAILGRTSSERTADILVALHNYDLKTKLQVLRFGKRYTPEETSRESEDTEISAFLAQNNSVKMYDRGPRGREAFSTPTGSKYNVSSSRYLPFWMAEKLRYAATTFWPIYRAHVENFTFDPWSDMPTGVTAEGLKNHFEKYLVWDFSRSENFAYKLPVLATELATSSKLVCVPKSYKGPRLICEEPLLSQCAQRKIEKGLRAVLSYNPEKLPLWKRKLNTFPAGKVVLTDQNRNRALCKEASITHELATIDLSRASDSLTYSVVHALIPKAWVNEVCRNLSTSVVLPNGKEKPLYICGTMGACETFPLETLVFWTIVCAAGLTCINFGVGDTTWFDKCAVYGDDIIVPVSWYETVVDFLTICGFTVNTEKSYTGDIPYRESCGVEYVDGYEVSSIYWPRRKFRGTVEDIPSLIALANRLFSVGAYEASSIVAELIDRTVKGVPRVAPESEKMGIWSYSVSRRLAEGKGCVLAKVVFSREYHHDKTITLPTTVPLDPPFFRCYESSLVVTYDTRLFSAPDVFDPHTRNEGKYLYDLYRYYRFLALGPEYDTGLDRLLHVSSHRADIGRNFPTGYRVSSLPYTIYDIIND